MVSFHGPTVSYAVKSQLSSFEKTKIPLALRTDIAHLHNLVLLCFQDGSRRSREGGSISPSSSSFPSFSSSSSSLLLPPLHLGLEIVGGASGGLQRIYGGRGGSSPPCPHVGSAPGYVASSLVCSCHINFLYFLSGTWKGTPYLCMIRKS